MSPVIVVVVQTSFVVVEPSTFRKMDLKETGPSWRLEVGGTTTSECKEGNLRRLVASVMGMVQTSFEVTEPSSGSSFVDASCMLDLEEAVTVTS